MLNIESASLVPIEVEKPLVVIVGSGRWISLLASAIGESGGLPLVIAHPEQVPMTLLPVAVIAGSPLSAVDMVRLTAHVRDRAVTPCAVITSLDARAPADLARDLRIVGAEPITAESGDLREMSEVLGRMTPLRVRSTPRGMLFTPILLRSGWHMHAAIACDVSEGGVGIEDVDPELVEHVSEAQFQLPGMVEPMTVAVEIAWLSGGDSRARAGLRFLDLDDSDRRGIRAFQGASPVSAA